MVAKAKEVTKVDNIPWDSLSSIEKNNRRAELRAKLNKDREIDSQRIRCRFKNYEMQGGDVRFSFKKYKDDPLETYHFLDGFVYTVPIGVIKHINKDCFFPMHKYATDENGNSIHKVSGKFQRFELIPLEFVDTEDLTCASSLVTVENI